MSERLDEGLNSLHQKGILVDIGKESQVECEYVYIFTRFGSILTMHVILQSGWSGCRIGNGEKLSNSQVCCLAQMYPAAA